MIADGRGALFCLAPSWLSGTKDNSNDFLELKRDYRLALLKSIPNRNQRLVPFPNLQFRKSLIFPENPFHISTKQTLLLCFLVSTALFSHENPSRKKIKGGRGCGRIGEVQKSVFSCVIKDEKTKTDCGFHFSGRVKFAGAFDRWLGDAFSPETQSSGRNVLGVSHIFIFSRRVLDRAVGREKIILGDIFEK
ncbi:hypothetical protein CDAR_76811 [Caerostris darwini]|uniref:Uncharacterized protein n=1 Tax=Caerostris darwini TaxID=1538125 RepID=A0AAV4QDN9_9ARAC|nr:hypothetical protein CDAR_76811 [Caerostris darwini]